MTGGRGRPSAVEGGPGASLRAAALVVQLSVIASYNGLHAQCPDGSPPPCRAAAAGARPTVDSNAVAILPFRVRGPDEVQYLREGMVDLLSIALDGVAGWRVIDPRRAVAGARAVTDPASVLEATRTARALGAGAVVLGSAVALGPELRVRAELYDAGGRRLATAVAVGDLGRPAPLVDTLAALLAKHRAGQDPEAGRRSLEDYTTSSPAALRAFLVAEHLARRAEWQSAAESLMATIAHDSGFALAYYRLYRALVWSDARTGLTRAAVVAGGMRYLERLPQRQQLILLLLDAHGIKGLRVEGLRLADELARRYPNDAEATLESGDAYVHLGLVLGEPPERALALLQRAIELDPGFPEPHLHVAQLLLTLNDTTAAWRALGRLKEIAPVWNGTLALELAMLIALRGGVAAALVPELPPARRARIVYLAERYVMWLLDAAPARAISLADILGGLASSPDRPRSERVTALVRRHRYLVARGKVAAAWALLEESASLDPGFAEVVASRVLHSLVTGQHQAEGRTAALELSTRDASIATWIPALLAWHAATQADPKPAQVETSQFVDSWENSQLSAYRLSLLAGLRGVAAARAGNSAAARANLAMAYTVSAPVDAADKFFFPDVFFSLELARLERAAGDLVSAARRLSDAQLPFGVLYRAEAEELRAQIAEQRSDTAAAVRAYQNLIELWRDADPELQPRVTAARGALARLEAP